MTSVETSSWLPRHLADLDRRRAAIPLFGAADVRAVLPGFDLWDLWPLQTVTNAVGDLDGGELWFSLAAPCQPDPEARHDIARIRCLYRKDDAWHDLGDAFADDWSPGSREWSGSALLLPDGETIVAYFTATGRRGETAVTFEQRLFAARGKLGWSDGMPSPGEWSAAQEVAVNDHCWYRDLAVDQGVPGLLKGYRDPGFFIDGNGKVYLLFAASDRHSSDPHDGVIAAAVAEPGNYHGPFELLPPVVAAVGVSSELERPHVVARDGLYYLFWSTHSTSFAPGCPPAPTGLYGMVGTSVRGPFEPLNGSGLVLANPDAEPTQAYCWQVLDSGEVVSFVNYWGLEGQRADTPAARRRYFGGTFAPTLHIELDGATTTITAR